MALRLSAIALLRLAGVALVASVPALVVACTSTVTPIGDGTPAPTASSTDETPPAPTTTATAAPTSTATAPPEKDAGVPDAAKDSGPPPTDVEGSAECTAYCAKMKKDCNMTCIPKSDCKIASGQCAASTKDFLDCKTTTGQWHCGSGGFSIVHNCKLDTSLCN